MRAVIPGSMGTASYVVDGLGEPTSFASASHGAGRLMSRTEARKRIRQGDLERVMRRVVFDPRRAEALVEEAPQAYRDIREVLQDEADLVQPLIRLEPIAIFKGR
jgi:tRNA-splicing ligase RtcB